MEFSDLLFPKEGVLGNTDAFALFALPYSIARLKFDEFLSYDLALATLFVVGFVSMALLLRDGLRLPHLIAILGAVLFTVFGSIFQRTFHAQLLAVETVPLMIWLAIAFVRSISTRQSALIAAGGAVVFAMTCLTGFYISWFFMLLIAWAAIVAIGIYGPASMFGKALVLARTKRIGFVVLGVSLLDRALSVRIALLASLPGKRSATFIGSVRLGPVPKHLGYDWRRHEQLLLERTAWPRWPGGTPVVEPEHYPCFRGRDALHRAGVIRLLPRR